VPPCQDGYGLPVLLRAAIDDGAADALGGKHFQKISEVGLKPIILEVIVGVVESRWHGS
jgi:hypothetical protein